MDIFQISGIAIITVALALTLNERKDMAMLIVLGGGIIILLQVIPGAAQIMQTIKNISQLAGIEDGYINIIFKATGIAIIVTVCSAVCRDAGQTGIAAKLEIAGRITILIVSLPVVSELFNIILNVIKQGW